MFTLPFGGAVVDTPGIREFGLWDLFADKLAACKAPMRPVSLTLKHSRDKYARAANGELMLVHLCTDCERITINRIAADDVPDAVIEVFESSFAESYLLRNQIMESGINLLDEESIAIVHQQLYGQTKPLYFTIADPEKNKVHNLVS